MGTFIVTDGFILDVEQIAYLAIQNERELHVIFKGSPVPLTLRLGSPSEATLMFQHIKDATLS